MVAAGPATFSLKRCSGQGQSGRWVPSLHQCDRVTFSIRAEKDLSNMNPSGRQPGFIAEGLKGHLVMMARCGGWGFAGADPRTCLPQVEPGLSLKKGSENLCPTFTLQPVGPEDFSHVAWSGTWLGLTRAASCSPPLWSLGLLLVTHPTSTFASYNRTARVWSQPVWIGLAGLPSL